MIRSTYCLPIAALAGVLAAQTTTWTSFEDRAGHAIASDFVGGVLMFGGESVTNPGTLLGDTSSLVNNNTTWVPRVSTTRPSERSNHAMASATDGLGHPIFVLFGGATPVPTNDTWVYGGGGWGPRSSVQRPSARTGHAMVTDYFRNKVVLFGGFSAPLPQNDVWEYDPVADLWSQIQVVGGSPPARRSHCLAFDPGADRIYTFGGVGFAGTLSDTWSYDPVGHSWTNAGPATSPLARSEAAMSYLLGNGVVLFGGKDATLQPLGDTWVFAGGNWTQRSPATSPPARSGHAMAQDQAGSNIVLLGGSDAAGNPVPGTWLWNGVNWTVALPPPSQRDGAAMAYDSTRQKHVLFGGRTVAGGADLADTWELDGVNWRQRAPGSTPPARSGAGMAYDSNSSRQRTVLFGGRTGGACGTLLSDTWEWTGANWVLCTPATSPPAAAGVQPVFDSRRNQVWMLVGSDMWSYDGTVWVRHASPSPRSSFGSCYDTLRNRLVVFGGDTAETGIGADVWEWDGSGWHSGASGPPGRRQSAMAFDPVSGVSLIHGGWDNNSCLADAWTWNGAAWTQVASFSARSDHAMVYSPAISRVALAGGTLPDTSSSSTTALWDGSAWTLYAGAGLPFGRTGMPMAYDPVNQRVVGFGGFSSALASETFQTMLFSGTGWAVASPAASPAPRRNAMLCFDSHSGRILLYGGIAGSAPTMHDTWLWDGTNWAQQFPTHDPGHRAAGALFSTGSRTIQFGGSDDGAIRNSMWEWTGSDWILIDSGSPTTRTNYGAAYDARRDRVVVFGGMTTCDRTTATYNNETWEWGGESWLQRFPANSPSPRGWCKLTYDEARARVVLFGGGDAAYTFQDLWEWDGTNWMSLAPSALPPSSTQHDLTFDKQQRVSVLFGRVGTWDYGPINPASAVSFGTGCAGSLGVPTLSPLPWAGPWLGGRFEVDIVNRPPGLGVFAWGFSDQNWQGLLLPATLGFLGSPACSLFVSPDVSEILLSGVNRYTSFVLPNSPLALGMTLHGQAGIFDLGLPGSPVITTNALHLTFGAR